MATLGPVIIVLMDDQARLVVHHGPAGVAGPQSQTSGDPVPSGGGRLGEAGADADDRSAGHRIRDSPGMAHGQD